MSHKTFMTVAPSIFGLVAIVHLLRLIFHWQLLVGSFMVPTWLSIVAIIIAGYLSYVGFKHSK